MTPPSERAVAEALAALQRLHHHGIVPLDEAREAARLLARDPSLEFPPPAPAGQEPAPGETGEAQTPS
jgi:hypothetical protein